MDRAEGEDAREDARLLPDVDALRSAARGPDESVVILDDIAAKPTPIWAWFLLCVSVLAFTCSGLVFSMMPEVPPLTLASWRLQATTALLVLPAALEMALCMDRRARWLVASSLWLLMLNGLILGIHFGLWVLSLQLTSLPHAMLFITMSPAIVACVSWVRGQPISRGELVGTALGVAGGAVLALSSAHHGGADARDPSWQGDLTALLGASLFVVHLALGRHLRAWMPMLPYSAAVTGLAAATLVVAALAVEGSGLVRWVGPGDGDPGRSAYAVFQWALDRRYAGKVAILAIVPGVLGHVGYNTLIRHMDALILTLAGSVEPLIGSVIGWLLGLVAAPPLLTYLGGATVIGSTVVVSIAGHWRQKRERALEQGLAPTRKTHHEQSIELA